jgi:hypothetical protein
MEVFYMPSAWNKNRLAYTPLGPYVARRYEEGLSYNQVAREVGIPKGCVQNLCRLIGITPRKNYTTNIPNVWEKRLEEYIIRTGAKIVSRPARLTKKSRVVTKCSHGITDRPCQVLEGMTFCCKLGSIEARDTLSSGWGVSSRERPLPGILYLIRYLDEAGIHFKIGITKLTLAQRFSKGQLVSIIHTYYSTLGECFDLEQSLLKWARKHGYRYSSPTTTELLLPAAIPHVLSELSSQQQCTSKSPASPSSSGACS